MPSLVVFCHANDPAAEDILGLCSFADRLCLANGLMLVCLAAGRLPTEEEQKLLTSCGADQIHFLPMETKLPSAGAVAREASRVLREIDPEIVLFSATNEDRIIASQIAAHLGTGLTADCSELSMEDGLLLQTRPAFGGSLFASILCPEKRPQMATVHPFLYPVGEANADRHAEVIEHAVQADDPALLLCETPVCGARLTDAETVFCGGVGLDEEGFSLLRELCDKTGAVLGATRAAVGAGLAPYRCQIGQTGVMLRAKTYIAFGVSGAVQHLAGIKNCARIAAVNTDKKAPIADACDLFIQADAKEMLRAFLSSLQS